ncbi:MAG: cytochrome c-type biogenesis protein CcmH [Candidatus Acidiferrales bacterium]
MKRATSIGAWVWSAAGRERSRAHKQNRRSPRAKLAWRATVIPALAMFLVVLLWLATPVGVASTSAQEREAPIVAGRPEGVKRVGKRMMCLCGCNQVLAECNHVGCSMSAGMINQLEERVARKEPDDLILQAFVQEYGQRVLAEPPATGFNLAAWLMPVFALVVGAIVVVVALTRMRRPAAAPVAARGPRVSPEALERLRMQADRESGE